MAQPSSFHRYSFLTRKFSLPSAIASCFALVNVLSMCFPSIALCQDQTWSNGAGNLIWDTTSNNWSGSTWSSGRGAIFGATGTGTIAMPGPISVNSLSFTSNGYTVNGTGPMTFVDGTSTQTTGVANVAAGVSATLNMPIISAVGFQKIGEGVLELGGTGNSFTGQIPLTSNGRLTAGFIVGPIGGLQTTTPLSGTVRLLSASAMPASTNVVFPMAIST